MMFSLPHFCGLQPHLSMIPIEFIPIPSSYSMENEHNNMTLINIEHVFTKENFFKKLIENVLYMCSVCINKIT